MAELRETGALGFTDDGLPVRQRRAAAEGPAVSAAVRRRDRPARGGSDPERRRGDARGRGLRGPRHDGDPEHLGVDDDRPRCRDRRLRGGAHPRPARLLPRVDRRGGGGQGGRGEGHRRGHAAPPRVHRRGDQGRAPHPLQDEPAAARRGRPRGARGGAARRHHRLRGHRPRPARASREGGAVRGGADGHDGPGDRLLRPLHRARGPGRAPARHADLPDDRGRGGHARSPGARDRAGRAGQPRAGRTSRPNGRWGSPATRAAPRTAPSPGAACGARSCSRVAAGAIAFQKAEVAA